MKCNVCGAEVEDPDVCPCGNLICEDCLEGNCINCGDLICRDCAVQGAGEHCCGCTSPTE